MVGKYLRHKEKLSTRKDGWGGCERTHNGVTHCCGDLERVVERVVERVREWRKCLLLLLLLIKKCGEKGARSPFTTKCTPAREGRGRFQGGRSRSIGSTDDGSQGQPNPRNAHGARGATACHDGFLADGLACRPAQD